MHGILDVIEDFKKDCPCGHVHETAVRDVRIGSGLVSCVGDILKENGFSASLLVVAEKNKLNAAKGIEASLESFKVWYKIYNDLRVATMEEVNAIEELIRDGDVSVLSVGTGSLNDICRLACARREKKLCIFATAPSMDGFASYGAPIVHKGFKATYAAKSPDVIIGDTKILAAAPPALKSAGFGDMMAKYVGLADWQISALLTGEYYCERIAALTREAADELMSMADKVTVNDEYTAGKIFEALLKTGVGMSFAKNSRPASGSEHVIAHLIECVELRDGIIPNYHGEDVGVCTLEMLKYYNRLAEQSSVCTAGEKVDWSEVRSFYGEMWEDVEKLNFPDNVVDAVDETELARRWQDIVKIIKSIPSYEECKAAMKLAGCKLTVDDIGKKKQLFDACVKFSPYMRRRLTLLRLRDMLSADKQ